MNVGKCKQGNLSRPIFKIDVTNNMAKNGMNIFKKIKIEAYLQMLFLTKF